MGKIQNQIKDHLADYALSDIELKDFIGGTWRNKSYSHILNEIATVQYNMLPHYRKSLIQHVLDKENGIKLHTDAHHLNSSQIMCMNFFFPLMQEKKLGYVLDLLDTKEEWREPEGQFEKISDIDGGQRGATYFDFFIAASNEKKAYFEIKYTENDFGTAKDDKSHNDKWNTIYRELVETSPVLKQGIIDKDYFFKNYQLLRNMVHVRNLQNDYVVFLVPEETLYKKAKQVIIKVVKPDALKHVRVIGWNEAFDAVKNDPQLADYYAEFYKKYLDFQ